MSLLLQDFQKNFVNFFRGWNFVNFDKYMKNYFIFIYEINIIIFLVSVKIHGLNQLLYKYLLYFHVTTTYLGQYYKQIF